MESCLVDRLRDDDDLHSRHEAADLIEMVYGFLWRDPVPSKIKSEARKMLLQAMNKDAQRRGIKYAHDCYGPTSETEILKYAE